jgi:hypothetical protein
MASRFGAKIIPFGAVGEDDICDVSASLASNFLDNRLQQKRDIPLLPYLFM